MDDLNIILNLFNKEMDESYQNLNRNHSQIKWFMQIYFFALTGFCALAGFLGSKANLLSENHSEFPPLATIIGTSSSLLIFFFGWLLLSSMAHKIVTVMMIHKHMATIRRKRLELSNFLKIDNYVLQINAHDVHPPKLVYYAPYIFFVFNYMFLLSSIIFFNYQRVGIINAVIFSLLVGVIVGLFYPRACITFNKHLWANRLASSFKHLRDLEIKWEVIRRRKINYKKMNYIMITAVTAIFIILFFTSLYITDINVYNIPISHWFLFESILLSAFFGIYRFSMEKKFNEIIKSTIKKDKA